MPRNTHTFSDKNFWFLRGLEESISFLPRGLGGFNGITLNVRMNGESEVITPKAVAYLGTDKEFTAVLSFGSEDQLFLFSGSGYEPYLSISFERTLTSIASLGSTLFALLADGHVLEVQIRPSDLEQLLTPLSLEQRKHNTPEIRVNEIANAALIQYTVTGLNIENIAENRIIPFETSSGSVRILAWTVDAADLWVGDLESNTAVFAKTTLGIKEALLKNLKLSSAAFHEHPRALYLSDAGSARIYFVPLYDKLKGLNAKIIIGDGLQGFPKGRAKTARFQMPRGLAVYDISKLRPPFTALFRDDPNSAQDKKKTDRPRRIPQNPILVIVDSGNSVVVTAQAPQKEGPFDREVSVLPLIGVFPDIREESDRLSSNLAMHPFTDPQEVAEGPAGSLLFWRPGGPKLYHLNPDFERRLSEYNKGQEYPIFIGFAPNS